jgi:SprT protein
MDLPREIDFSRTRAPAVDAALKLAARQRLAQCVQLAHGLGIRLPMPTVSFDLRGRTAGQAYWTKNHVRLNAVLLTENPSAFIARTVGHEVAHLAARVKYGEGIDPHGPEWQAVMVAFGQDPSRCHSYDTANAAVGGTFTFVCGCAKPFQLGARQRKRGLRGDYRCRKCKQVLRPADDTAEPAAPPPAKPSPRATTPASPATPRQAGPAIPAARPPTDAMVRYARDLAARAGLALPAAVLKDFALCSQFIEQTKQAPAVVPPTARQLAYATQLATRLGLPLPKATLASRNALSAWLDDALARSAS